MSLTVIWTASAFTTLRNLRAQDPPGASAVGQATSALAEEPDPVGVTRLGPTNFRRLRLGAYRVLYEIDQANSAILIHSVGLVHGGREQG